MNPENDLCTAEQTVVKIAGSEVIQQNRTYVQRMYTADTAAVIVLKTLLCAHSVLPVGCLGGVGPLEERK